MQPESEPSNRYQLLDFGNGRKLESLAGYIVDRPSAAADGTKRKNPNAWRAVDARYDARARQWKIRNAPPNDLIVSCGSFLMPIRLTPFGHIGIFPEQQPNWNWLSKPTSTFASSSPNAEQNQQPLPQALNLFAYTGASTMALATAGFAVAHVDAAKPSVAAAKSAAALNRFSEHPIRYLVDDVPKFVDRELRRRKQYSTIILDPPAYGHGPKGKAWRLERDLWPLLDACCELMQNRSAVAAQDVTTQNVTTQNTDRPSLKARLLVTGHSESVGQSEIADFLYGKFKNGNRHLTVNTSRLGINDQNDRTLDAGFQVRAELTEESSVTPA